MPTRDDKETKKKASQTEDAGIVESKKYVMVEKAKKYLETIQKGLSKKIHKTKEVQVAEEGARKTPMAFITFAEGGADAEENLQENVNIIKDILFGYHTFQEKESNVIREVTVFPPTETGKPYLLSYTEYAQN